MPKKVIQVPVDEELLEGLDELAKRRHRTRSELIRQACRRYLKEAEVEELDRLYQQGYEEIPEEPALGEAQATLAVEILPTESW